MENSIGPVQPYEVKNIKFEDNVSSSIRHYETIGGNKNIGIIVVPALGVRMSYYHILGLELSKSGFGCILTEMRGTGESSAIASRKNSYGFYESIHIEIPFYVDMMKRVFGYERVYILGHSLGGQIAAISTTTMGDIEGAILVASGSNYWRLKTGLSSYSRLIKYIVARVLATTFGYFPGEKIGFAGKEGKAMILDWTYEGIFGKYCFLKQKNDHNSLLKKVKKSFLFLPIQEDKWVSIRDAEFLAAKFCKSTISIILLNKDRFFTKVDHFKWVQEPEPIVEEVVRWIERHKIKGEGNERI